MNYTKIRKIRKNLDFLDNKLLNLIKKRAILVNQILKQKKYKNQIVDKKRINQVLKNIRSKSVKKNLDTKISNKIWKSMIKAFIDYEYKNFKKK
jgi:chorismate mutase